MIGPVLANDIPLTLIGKNLFWGDGRIGVPLPSRYDETYYTQMGQGSYRLFLESNRQEIGHIATLAYQLASIPSEPASWIVGVGGESF